MRCKYCGRRLREGERCGCRSQRQPRMEYQNQPGSRQQDPYGNRNSYGNRDPYGNAGRASSGRKNSKAAARKRRKKRIRRFFVTLIVICLLAVLGMLGYRWLQDNGNTVLSKIPFLQNLTGKIHTSGTIAQNVGETTVWSDEPVVKAEHSAEIARIREQYEAGRIDYGGVKKNLGRMDTSVMSETDLQSCRELAARVEQELRDMVAGYVNSGSYSEARELLSRMSQTLPGDSVVGELISQYGGQIGM